MSSSSEHQPLLASPDNWEQRQKFCPQPKAAKPPVAIAERLLSAGSVLVFLNAFYLATERSVFQPGLAVIGLGCVAAAFLLRRRGYDGPGSGVFTLSSPGDGRIVFGGILLVYSATQAAFDPGYFWLCFACAGGFALAGGILRREASLNRAI